MVDIGVPTFASQTSADFFGPLTNLGSRKLARAKITPHFHLQGVQRLIREQTPDPKELHLPKICGAFPWINAHQHGARKDRPTIPFDGSNIAKQATGGWVFSGTELTNQHRRTSTLGVNPRVVQNWRHRAACLRHALGGHFMTHPIKGVQQDTPNHRKAFLGP